MNEFISLIWWRNMKKSQYLDHIIKTYLMCRAVDEMLWKTPTKKNNRNIAKSDASKRVPFLIKLHLIRVVVCYFVFLFSRFWIGHCFFCFIRCLDMSTFLLNLLCICLLHELTVKLSQKSLQLYKRYFEAI